MFGKVVQNSMYFSFTNTGAKTATRIDFQAVDNGVVKETLSFTGIYAQGDVNQNHIPADPQLSGIDDALTCTPTYVGFSDGTSWGTPSAAAPAPMGAAPIAMPGAPLWIECHGIKGIFGGTMQGAMGFSYKNIGTKNATRIEFQAIDNGKLKETFSYTRVYVPNVVTNDFVTRDRHLTGIDMNITCVPSYVLFADGTSWGTMATPSPEPTS